MNTVDWQFQDHEDRPYIISKDGNGMPFITQGKGWFFLKNRSWQFDYGMFRNAPGQDKYRDSFANIPEMQEPYDWCIRQFGPNWGTWGSKIISMYAYVTNRGTQTGYHDFKCEFHFANKDDLTLFKLSFAN